LKADPYHVRTSFGVIAAKLVAKVPDPAKPQPDVTGDKPKADLPGKGTIIDVQT
jgi:hypothetical protein